MSTHFILVPGFWLGAWAWDSVKDALTAEGGKVTALTLPSQSGGDATLADDVDAIAAAIQDGGRQVLVAHSGGAFAAAQVLNNRPGLVDHLILVDTALPGDETAFNAEQEGDFLLESAWDGLRDEGSFRDLTEEQLAVLKERAVPVPEVVVTTPVRLDNPERLTVPVTAICTAFSAEEYRQAAEAGVPYFADMPNYENLTYVDLSTGHWPMWSKPEELAAILLQAGEAR